MIKMNSSVTSPEVGSSFFSTLLSLSLDLIFREMASHKLYMKLVTNSQNWQYRHWSLNDGDSKL